jgi:hypothetical protein
LGLLGRGSFRAGAATCAGTGGFYEAEAVIATLILLDRRLEARSRH